MMNQPDPAVTGGNIENSSVSSRLNRWADVAYWVLLLAGCALFLLMNIYTTVKEDDLFHSMIGGGSGRPINNLLDVLRSWVEYYQYDARTANLISFTFNGILGKTAFNICNTVVFGLMVHMVCRMKTGLGSVMALVMLFTYMVTAMPVPGETLLWATGAFNYLWAFTASLLLYLYLMNHRDKRPGWLKGALLVLLSMFVGGINEGTTFGVFGGLVLFYLFNRDQVDRTVILVMTGYLLGVLLLLTCPGAWDRAADEVAHDTGFLALMADRFSLLWSKSWQYVTPALALIVVLFSIFTLGLKRTFSNPFTFIFLVLLAFVFVVGKDQQRLYFSVSMIGFAIVAGIIDAICSRKLWLNLAVIAIGLVLCFMYYPGNIRTMKRYQAFFNEVENEIKQSPDRQVILPAKQFDGYSRFIKYFNFNSWNYLIREETLCHHYGKDNIQFVPSFIFDRYRDGILLDNAVPTLFEAPDCPDVETVLADVTDPDFEYMMVKMRQDTISHSYQFAQAYLADGTPAEFPVPYFPLLYQGNEYLIFPLPDAAVSRLTFSPYALDGPTIDLVRTAPNPTVDDYP